MYIYIYDSWSFLYIFIATTTARLPSHFETVHILATFETESHPTSGVRSFSRCFWIKLPRRPRSGLVILKTFHSFVLQVNLHHFAILNSIKLILSFKPLSGFSTRILFYILYFHPVNLVLYPTYNYFRNLNLMLGNSFLNYIMNYILSFINKFLFNQIIQAEIKINVGHATFAQRE